MADAPPTLRPIRTNSSSSHDSISERAPMHHSAAHSRHNSISEDSPAHHSALDSALHTSTSHDSIQGRVFIENSNHSPHPSRVYMSIHPKGKSCGHVRSQFECSFSMTLIHGAVARRRRKQSAVGEVGAERRRSVVVDSDGQPVLGVRQGLPLVHFSAQPVPFLSMNAPNISHDKRLS
jgi:hypothetical protein